MKNLIHPELQKLHSIYASEFPDFVIPFLSAPALLRLKKIDQNCGSQYSLLCDQRIYYSRLEHSLGVALIVWHFSGDKVQTLSGLFHDISHTVFSHVGDFLLGDAMKQESAELHTTHIIESDPVISCELEKLGIRVDEVDNYELYPIADNPGPRLSADRLEYTLSTALATNPSPATFEKIRKIYNNIHVGKNLEGDIELVFSELQLAKEFGLQSIQNDAEIFSSYHSVIIQQSLADILKHMVNTKMLSLDEIYTKNDEDIIQMILESNDMKLQGMWQVFSSMQGYIVHYGQRETKNIQISSLNKRRYIDPLIEQNKGNPMRLTELSREFKGVRDYHITRREEWIEVPNSSVFLEK